MCEGPTLDQLCIDMRSSLSSKWNIEVREILLRLLLETRTGEGSDRWEGLPERSDGYFYAIFGEQLQCARTEWK
jgi:hypothetical protein